MSRSVRRRTVSFSAVLACALLVSAAALAAKPKRSAHFTGTENVPVIEGFHAPVTFKVSSNGKLLDRFTFGTIGCFGAGGFRPGVNPYTGYSLIEAGAVKVSASGSLSDKTLSSYTVSGQTTTTTISITGRFKTPKSVSGTITFSQVVTGEGINTHCGPAIRPFTASTH